MKTSGGFVGRALSWMVVFLAISAAYLYAFPQPNIFYAAVVLLHAAGGLLATILLLPMLSRLLRTGSFSSRGGWLADPSRRNPRNRSDQDWNVSIRMEQALSPHRDFDGWRRTASRRVARPRGLPNRNALARGCLVAQYSWLYVWQFWRVSATERATCGKAGRRATGFRIRRCLPAP